MPLTPEAPQRRRDRIAQGDPLPPDDRLTRGTVIALEVLYRAQAPRLTRFFARRTDRQEVSDLVQESFVRMAQAARDPERDFTNPEAYLSQIASNILRNRAKSALQRSMTKHVAIDDVVIPGPDTIASLEARDLLRRLQIVLTRLPRKTRDIFLAHRVDGLSYKELAEKEGLSMKGVEWHMRKAITYLDKAMRLR